MQNSDQIKNDTEAYLKHWGNIDPMEWKEMSWQEKIATNESLSKPFILRRLKLAYRTEYGLMMCVECKAIIFKGFSDHAYRNHAVPKRKSDDDVIKSMYDLVSSKYLHAKHNIPLESLDFLEVLDGFYCECGYVGCSVSSRTKHMKVCQKLVARCSVQAVTSDAAKKYIRVLDRN